MVPITVVQGVENHVLPLTSVSIPNVESVRWVLAKWLIVEENAKTTMIVLGRLSVTDVLFRMAPLLETVCEVSHVEASVLPIKTAMQLACARNASLLDPTVTFVGRVVESRVRPTFNAQVPVLLVMLDYVIINNKSLMGCHFLFF